MRRSQQKTTVGLTFAATVTTMLLWAATAGAVVSTKLLSTGQFGWNVNKTKIELGRPQKERNVCTVASKDTCQNGEQSHEAGGFTYDYSVAADPTSGNVYVADNNSNRIEEFTASGEFILMFGWKVNKTTGGNICTAASGDKCGEGEAGTGLSGQLSGGQSVAVDPGSHVYVLELFYQRIEEFTATGEFVLMIGGNVNKTKVEEGTSSEAARNLCTAASHDTCQPGEFMPSGPAHGAFRKYPAQFQGNLLAVGGPEHLLYSADEGRVQELAPSGEWKGEVSLAAVSPSADPLALAVDPVGNIYLAVRESVSPYTQIGGIHKLNGEGKAMPGFTESDAGQNNAEVKALAVDPATGRFAAVENRPSGLRGSLYDGAGTRLSNFEPAGGFGVGFVEGVAFNAKDELYAADAGHQDIEMYAPAPVPQVKTEPCTKVTASGLTLTGEVNPENVSETKAWFVYGTTAKTLGLKTPVQEIAPGNAFVPITATVEASRPNETYYYRAMAEGKTDPEQPEEGKELSCLTLLVPPKIEGKPEADYVTFSSAVLFGAVNPENAKTEYFFEYGTKSLPEYGPCKESGEEPASYPSKTTALESSAYGAVGVVRGARDLQPSTSYYYRLVAINHSKDLKGKYKCVGEEARFTTLPAPSLAATTEPVSSVTATSATLNGIVNPDGAGATYAFQVGIYNGASTVYSTIAQGPTGSGAGLVPESFTLTGLQPGTTYAYRIAISSAYRVSEGAPVTFTTAGLSTVLFAPTVLPQLTIPNIAFPEAIKTPPRCKRRGYKHNGRGKCVKPKRGTTGDRKGIGRKSR